ncbi:hypothetical protein A5906_23865 [Bradyrhizobium sacchari]|nr:hypothetical protein A5906_23865 [Bradyrhizobium sacchari]
MSFAASPQAALSSPVSTDVIAYTVELAGLFDIDPDQHVEMFTFIAPHLLGRLRDAQSVQS